MLHIIPPTKPRFSTDVESAKPLRQEGNPIPIEAPKKRANKALIKKLSDGITAALKKEAPAMKAPPNFHPNFFYEAPLLIIITAPKDNHFAVSDGALAAQNIMLCAASLDLGSCFIGMARFIKKDPEMCRELHIDDNMDIVATVICGYPAEDPEPRPKHLNAEYFK